LLLYTRYLFFYLKDIIKQERAGKYANGSFAVLHKSFLNHFCSPYFVYTDNEGAVTGNTIPTIDQMIVLMTKDPEASEELDLTHFHTYVFQLLPVLNPDWKKALKVMTSTKQPLSAATWKRCLNGSDHAMLMQILRHHRPNWISDIVEGVTRKKGMTTGSNKMASDTAGYNINGRMGHAWMSTDHWTNWLRRGMQVHEPLLDFTEELDDANVLNEQVEKAPLAAAEFFADW
jgi:hypothetical protein